MQKKVKISIIVLAVLLTLSVLALVGVLIAGALEDPASSTAVVPDNLITPDAKAAEHYITEGQSAAGTPLASAAEPTANTVTIRATEAPTETSAAAGATANTIYLHSRNAGDNEPFNVTNMFPGDAETKYFCVRVSHSGAVTVRYHADIRSGYEKLAEVLKCRVVLLTTGETLYDGLMRDMPEALTHRLQADGATTSELYYEITAYLDTSVGNEYQRQALVADFRWWIEESGELEPPNTGDTGNIIPYAVTAVVSLFLLILLLKKRPKEDAEDAR